MSRQPQEIEQILNLPVNQLQTQLTEDRTLVDDITSYLAGSTNQKYNATISLDEIADSASLNDTLGHFTTSLQSKIEKVTQAIYGYKSLTESLNNYFETIPSGDLVPVYQGIQGIAQRDGQGYPAAIKTYMAEHDPELQRNSQLTAYLNAAANLYENKIIKYKSKEFWDDGYLLAQQHSIEEDKNHAKSHITQLNSEKDAILRAGNTTLTASTGFIQHLALNGNQAKLAALRDAGIPMDSLNDSITFTDGDGTISATFKFPPLCAQNTLKFCSEGVLSSPAKNFDLKIDDFPKQRININEKTKDKINAAYDDKLDDLVFKFSSKENNSKILQQKFISCQSRRDNDDVEREKASSKDLESAYKLLKLLAGVIAIALMAYVIGGIGLEFFSNHHTGWLPGDGSGLFKYTVGNGAMIAGGLGAGAATYAILKKGMDSLIYVQRASASKLGNTPTWQGLQYKDTKFTQTVGQLIGQLSENDKNELGLKPHLNQETINKYYNKSCVTQFGNPKPRFDMGVFIGKIADTDDNSKLTQLLTGERGIHEILKSSKNELEQLQHQKSSQVTALNTRHPNQTGRGRGAARS